MAGSNGNILASLNGLGQVDDGAAHGLGQGQSACQERRDGRRERASRAMGVASFDGGMLVGTGRLAGHIQSVHLLLAFPMAALDKHGLASQLDDAACGLVHVGEGADGHVGQHLGLRQVGREHRGHGQQLLAEGVDSVGLHQGRPTGRHHDWVDHHKARMVGAQGVGNGLQGGAVVHHANLDGHGHHVVHHSADLSGHHVGPDGLHGLHAQRVLHRDRCDGRCSINP